jgi:hypothetical protein
LIGLFSSLIDIFIGRHRFIPLSSSFQHKLVHWIQKKTTGGRGTITLPLLNGREISVNTRRDRSIDNEEKATRQV